MRNTTTLSIAFLIATLLPRVSFSQTEGAPVAVAPPLKYFRLDFVVKELENGKMLNARAYSMMTSGSLTRVRTGNKLPIPNGSGGGFNYVDVGVNIDCDNAKEIQNQLAFDISAEISTVPADVPQGGPPAIRQNQWTSNVSVPLSRPTVLFSSDDVASKRQMQLELTATPIK